MTYADKIKIACKWKRMTQAELAKQAGISVKTIQKYMSGKTVPDVATAIKINEIIGLPYDYFFSDNLPFEEDGDFMEIYKKMRDFIIQSKHENTINEQASFSFIFDDESEYRD